MRKRVYDRVHTPGLLRSLFEHVRGREQMLVRGFGHWPLLLVSFPPGGREAADELRESWLHTLPSLQTPEAEPYHRILSRLPVIVVVLLRSRNVCTCLGHHHPMGTESRLARRLAVDAGCEVGEIDLAWESIRDWQPQPLASLASGVTPNSFARLHFRAALLTVLLLHELEHLAFPDREESSVRNASDEFYTYLLGDLLRQEGAPGFGMLR